MSTGEVSVDKMVKVYIKMRDAKDALKKEFDTKEAALVEQMDAIKGQLLEVCKDTGTEGLKTAYGTVTRKVVTRYWTSDWAAMHAFVKEHDALDLLERRVAQSNMKAFLEEHPDDKPVGLNSDSKYDVVIRRK